MLIDKLVKLGTIMKKHKSHARHVFNYLEKHYNVYINSGDEDSKKGSKRKSVGNKSTKLRENEQNEGSKDLNFNSALVEIKKIPKT